MATRNLVINDPVGIHARPAAQFGTGRHRLQLQRDHRYKEGGDAVPAGSCILSIMGLWASSRAAPWVINVEGTTPMRAPTS